jgi:membrane-anchored protein YejM (alkaline phosphatase superfamily)
MEKDEKLRLQTIRQASIRYKQISLWLTAAVALAVLFACRLSAQCDDMIAQVVNPLVVSAIFSLVASPAYGEAWKAVAKSSPANLAKFYMAALVIKMVAGTLVFLIYVLVCDKQNILGFTAIFALFYVVLLVFDCIYFARVEKKNRLS